MSAALHSFEAQWRARSADALQPFREQAMQRFLKLGLPTLRDETWRYTDLRSVAAQSLRGCLLRSARRDRPQRIAVLGGRRSTRGDREDDQRLSVVECRYEYHKGIEINSTK